MNGLAASRRSRGLVGSVLNIGVIYGLGLLARERQEIYEGLEREGYPPISERDIHHMFIEAIVAGRPVPGQIMDITTGLRRYHINDPNPLHWHSDPRFSHYTVSDDSLSVTTMLDNEKQSVRALLDQAKSMDAITEILVSHLARRLEFLLQLPAESVDVYRGISDLGVDSLAAVEVRNWIYKTIGRDVPVLKILGSSIEKRESKLCNMFPRRLLI